MCPSISIQDFYDLVLGRDVAIFDVRAASRYANGHVPGAVNIPLDNLAQELDKFDSEKMNYIICHTGVSSQKASQFLADKGFLVTNVAEGTSQWPGQLEY